MPHLCHCQLLNPQNANFQRSVLQCELLTWTHPDGDDHNCHLRSLDNLLIEFSNIKARVAELSQVIREVKYIVARDLAEIKLTTELRCNYVAMFYYQQIRLSLFDHQF
jgi:hypothetical protein